MRPVPQVMDSVLEALPAHIHQHEGDRVPGHQCMWVGKCGSESMQVSLLNATFITRKKKTKSSCTSEDGFVIVV